MKSVCLDLRQPLRYRISGSLRPAHDSCMVVRPSRAWFMHGGPSGPWRTCCWGSPYLSNRSVRPIARGPPPGASARMWHVGRLRKKNCARAHCADFFEKFSLVRKARHTDGRTEDAVFVCLTGGKAQVWLRSASPL